MAIIEKLNWDSNFFGKRIGRVQLIDEKDFDPEIFLIEAKESFDLIYIFSYQQMISHPKIQMAQLELADIMITMTKPFNRKEYLPGYYDFRTTLSSKELNECYEIAEQTSVVSRFFKDPIAGERKTKELYRKWIDNALNQSFSDGLFIEKTEDRIIGIHLIKTIKEEKTGIFTLTGVNTNFKNTGIGTKLWQQSFSYWANQEDINVIKSPFSFQNKASFNFHLKMGFNRIIETKFIYHFRNI